jgi:hypothetical protein
MKLGEILIGLGMVTPDQLRAALQAQSVYTEKLGTTLVESGIITTDQLAQALSRQFGVPAAQEVHFARADPALRSRLKAAQVARLQAIPLYLMGPRRVVVAMVDPGNAETIQELSFVLGATVEPMVTADIVLVQMLERLYGVPRRRTTNVAMPGRASRSPSPESDLRLDTVPLAADVSTYVAASPSPDEPRSGSRPRRLAGRAASLEDLPPLMPAPGPLPSPSPDEPRSGSRARRASALMSSVDELPPLTPAAPPAPFAYPPHTPPAPAFVPRSPGPPAFGPADDPAPPMPGFAPLAPGPVPPMPGFAPPAPGPVPPMPGFAPPAPGPVPPMPGFAPPAPGRAPPPPPGSKPQLAPLTPLPDSLPSHHLAPLAHPPPPGGPPAQPTSSPLSNAPATPMPVFMPLGPTMSASPAPADVPVFSTPRVPTPPTPAAHTPRVPTPPTPATHTPRVPTPPTPATSTPRVPTPPTPAALTGDQAVRQILAARNRAMAAEALKAFMRSSFSAGAMFAVSGIFAMGRFGFGPSGPCSVEGISFSLSLQSCFRLAYSRRATYCGAPPAEGAAVHQRLWTALGGEIPSEVMVAPVVVNEQIAVLLYAHGRGGILASGAVGKMEQVCLALGSVLGRLKE